MKCPECGKEMRKGITRANYGGSLTNCFTFMEWYPEDQKKELFKSDVVNLRIKGEGYYCEECMKVFAIFEQK